MDEPEKELLFEIYRVKIKDEWTPAILAKKTHDITPMWAAATAFIVLDTYLNSIEEVDQIEFQNEMLRWLHLMLKDNEGSSYIETLNIKPPN